MAGIIEVKDQGKVRIYDADNSNYIDIVVPSTVSSNRTITIPDASFTVPQADTVYTHPNHSGEVTSTADGATVIADNIVDEANLKVSNSPTNGYMLTAQSGNTGGLTWAEAGGGKILQVIQDEYPTEQSSTSTSFVDIGGLSVSITPSSTSSKIFAMATLTSCRGIATNHTSCNVFYRLVRGSTELTHSRLNYYDNNANANREIDGAIALSYLDTPNSTSAQTYKCQMKALSGNTVKVNVADSSNSAMSTITVFEVGA